MLEGPVRPVAAILLVDVCPIILSVFQFNLEIMWL